MRIWLINHYAHDPKEYGGTRHYDLAKAWAEQGHQVTIFAASFHHYTHCQTRQYGVGQFYQYEQISGIQYVWLKTMAYSRNGFKRVWGMLQFRRRVIQAAQQIADKPDVIFASSPHLFATDAAAQLSQCYRVPFVMEVRDIWPLSLIELGLCRWHPFVLWLKALERKSYGRADHIVSVIPYLNQYLREQGVNKPFSYINHGVDMRYLDQRPPVADRDSKRLQVIYAGSLGRANNINILVEAAQQLQGQGIAVDIEVYGEGPMKQQAQQQAIQLQLNNIRFYPAVSRQKIFAVLCQADILFCNMPQMQLYRYGISPNKLNDYLLAARPIIYACHSKNDIVGQAQAGLTIAPNDANALANAIIEMVGLPQSTRQEMGQNGLAYAKQYCDIDKHALAIETIFQRLREP